MIHRAAIAFVFILFLAMNFWGLASSNIQEDILLSSTLDLAKEDSIRKAFPSEFLKGVEGIKPSYCYPYKFWLIWIPSTSIVLLIFLYPITGPKFNTLGKKGAPKRASS